MPNIKVFAGSSHPELAQRICERLQLNVCKASKKNSNWLTRDLIFPAVSGQPQEIQQ